VFLSHFIGNGVGPFRLKFLCNRPNPGIFVEKENASKICFKRKKFYSTRNAGTLKVVL